MRPRHSERAENATDILPGNQVHTLSGIEESVQAFLTGDITFAQLTELCVDQIDLLTDWGHSYIESGKIDEACRLFESLSSHYPMEFQFHVILGSIHQCEHRFEDAARHFKSAIELRPEDLGSWANLGETMLRWCGSLSHVGQVDAAAEAFKGAVEALSKAIQLTPTNDRGSALRARALVAAAASVYEARKTS